MLRIAAGLAFAYMAYRHSSETSALTWTIAFAEAACAALLLAGLYTQAAALLGIAIFFAHALVRPVRVLPLSSMLFLFALCLSLLVTGAGAFAFDLPL